MAQKEGKPLKNAGKTGWSIEETELLFSEIDRVTAENQPIKRAFEAVAKKTGRQPNSIRNYYYVKLREDPSKGKAAFVPFDEQELRMLVEAMLLGQAEGKSVRGVAFELGHGEKKAMLRYQNKYRGLLRTNPGYIEAVLRELRQAGRIGATISFAKKRRHRPSVEQALAELADNLAQFGKDGEAVLYGLNNIVSAAARHKEDGEESKLLSELAVQFARNQELERRLSMLQEQGQAAFSEELSPRYKGGARPKSHGRA